MGGLIWDLKNEDGISKKLRTGNQEGRNPSCQFITKIIERERRVVTSMGCGKYKSKKRKCKSIIGDELSFEKGATNKVE